MIYDAENRLVEVKKNNVTTAQFTFDGDGKRVKSVIGAETILFAGGHYEKKGSTITKYYFAGATRIAMRKYTIPQNMTVEYFLSDHIGSTSITTDNAGVKVSEMRYKPWGELRYSWTNAPANTSPVYELVKYQYTGQYSYSAEFGLLFFNARWLDPATGRFAQADTIVSGGVQGFDRYAYVGNNPVKYIDPSGHKLCDREFEGDCKHMPSHGSYGVLFDGEFGEKQKNNIMTSVELVAYALWVYSLYDTPWEAFRAVYNKLEFGRCGQGKYASETCDALGWAKGRSLILFGGFYNYSDEKQIKLVIHELGHAFDRYMCETTAGCDPNSMGRGSARFDLEGRLHGCSSVTDGSDCLGRFNYTNPSEPTNPYWGFAGDFGNWQFAKFNINLASEIFADMFLGWVTNSWWPGISGANRSTYMNTTMPTYLNR